MVFYKGAFYVQVHAQCVLDVEMEIGPAHKCSQHMTAACTEAFQTALVLSVVLPPPNYQHSKLQTVSRLYFLMYMCRTYAKYGAKAYVHQ